MIKLILAGETRKIVMVSTYDELVKKTKEVFGPNLPSTYKFYYVDLEGDWITMATQEDFEAAKMDANECWKLFIGSSLVNAQLGFNSSLEVISEEVGVDSNIFLNNTENPLTVDNSIVICNKPEESTVRISEQNNSAELLTVEALPNADPSKHSLQANFIDYDNDKVYEIEPNKIFPIVLKLQNTGSSAWPEDTVLSNPSGELIVKSVAVGAVQPGMNKEVTIEIKTPADRGKYVGTFQLLCQKSTTFGLIATVTLTVKSIPIIKAPPNIQFEEVYEEVKRFRTSVIMTKLQVPRCMEENMQLLLDIFKKRDSSSIFDALNKANNDLPEAIRTLFVSSKNTNTENLPC